MVTNTNKTAIVGSFHRIREYLKEESALFGLIRWERVIGTESIGDEQLRIFCPELPPKIVINGIEYVPKI